MALKLAVGMCYLNSNQNSVNEPDCTVILEDEHEVGQFTRPQSGSYDGKEFSKGTQGNKPVQTTISIQKNGLTTKPLSTLSVPSQTAFSEPVIIRKMLSPSYSPVISVNTEPSNPSTQSPDVVSTSQVQKVRLQRSDSFDYKEELRKKILERRKAEGKNVIDLEEEEEKRKRELQNLNQLTQQDIEKRLLKRKNNRMAAKRCREKKRLTGIKTEMETSIQYQRNKELKMILEVLKVEKEMLERIWREANSQPGSQISQETINNLIRKDYEKLIPKPMSAFQVSMENDSSTASSSDEKTDNFLPHKEVGNQIKPCRSSVQPSVEYVKNCPEVNRNGISSDLPKTCFESCSIKSKLKSPASKKWKSDFYKEQEVIDLTDNDSASFQIKVERDTESRTDLTTENFNSDDRTTNYAFQMNDFDKIQARSLLLEAAEAAYCEINYLEETSLRNTESSSQESNISVCATDNDSKVIMKEDEASDDEDDILPLVIDFGSDEKEIV